MKDLESCACIKHSNMQFMATKLKFVGVIATNSLNDIFSSVVCNKNFKECMCGTCNSCAGKQILPGNENQNWTENVKWHAWTIIDHEYGEPGNTKKTKKMTKTENEGSYTD